MDLSDVVVFNDMA